MKKIFLFILLLSSMPSFGQEQLLNIAREYFRNGQFDKAADSYKQLLEYQPNNREIFQGYFQSLLQLNQDKEAERLVNKQIKTDKGNKENYLFLAKIYKKQQDVKKFRKAIEKYTEGIGQNSNETRITAKALEKEGYYQEAVDLYEYSKKKNKEDAYLYAEELAILYSKLGKRDEAIENLLNLYVINQQKSEDIRSTFQQLFLKPADFDELRKKVLKRSAKELDNIAYYDLLAWIYIQQDDYEGALKQIKSIDVRLGEDGRRLLGFARTCLREKKYAVALQAYDALIEKGSKSPFESISQSEKLTTLKEELVSRANYTNADVKKVCDYYKDFLTSNPTFKNSESSREYADLLARYLHDIPAALAVLQELVDMPRAQKQLRGRAKLDMGDYQLLQNNIWESTLLYSQVDKEFKQDILGEEAQFRNAKLAFYRGDFSWAQTQLDILKASTTELISNDAIDLSVLITENNPIKDSDDFPLRLFAEADLLIYQTKYAEALRILDSMEIAYPSHPLMDNILMERSKMAIQKRDYAKAALYLQKIIDFHKDDVLADDALYQLASIYETHFSNPDEAKRLYEKLILDYPGSTYAERARKNFRRLRGDKLDG